MCPRRTWLAGRPGSGSTGICAAPAVPCGAASVPPFRDRRGRTLRSAGSSWGLAMRNRQQGITSIGWLVLLAPFAIVLYAGIRLAPLYLNYMKVVREIGRASCRERV